MINNNLPRLADQDPDHIWTHRVIGYSAAGSVTGTEVVMSDLELEAAHDRIMSLPGTCLAETFGPFRLRKAVTS